MLPLFPQKQITDREWSLVKGLQDIISGKVPDYGLACPEMVIQRWFVLKIMVRVSTVYLEKPCLSLFNDGPRGNLFCHSRLKTFQAKNGVISSLKRWLVSVLNWMFSSNSQKSSIFALHKITQQQANDHLLCLTFFFFFLRRPTLSTLPEPGFGFPGFGFPGRQTVFHQSWLSTLNIGKPEVPTYIWMCVAGSSVPQSKPLYNLVTNMISNMMMPYRKYEWYLPSTLESQNTLNLYLLSSMAGDLCSPCCNVAKSWAAEGPEF